VPRRGLERISRINDISQVPVEQGNQAAEENLAHFQ
jgi:hypothetical protein